MDVRVFGFRLVGLTRAIGVQGLGFQKPVTLADPVKISIPFFLRSCPSTSQGVEGYCHNAIAISMEFLLLQSLRITITMNLIQDLLRLQLQLLFLLHTIMVRTIVYRDFPLVAGKSRKESPQQPE